ncbi:hypothetical protein BVX98_07960 [bacterium F11]|nr:hypothetical protein BVX98_07960 [bacterium F11]
MITTQKQFTEIGLGFAIQSDPFQAGREAAQMAKSQLSQPTPHLVLAFGPDHFRFQDFMEGVRLVTGKDMLVGISTSRVLSQDIFSPQACVVVIINSNQCRFSTAWAHTEMDNTLAAITTLFSQLRETRGNIRSQFQHQNLFLFENRPPPEDPHLPHMIMTETGLESCFIKMNLQRALKSSLMCQNHILSEGLIAIECLSPTQWGFGAVEIEDFKNHPQIYREATRAAIRNALAHMDKPNPCLGFVLLNFQLDNLATDVLSPMFSSSHDIIQNVPLIGLASKGPFIRYPKNMINIQKESIVTILIPQ